MIRRSSLTVSWLPGSHSFGLFPPKSNVYPMKSKWRLPIGERTWYHAFEQLGVYLGFFKKSTCFSTLCLEIPSLECILIKSPIRQCHEIFYFGFFHDWSSQDPLIIPLVHLRISSKTCEDIRSSRFTTSVVDTDDKWEKCLNIFFPHYFVQTLLSSSLHSWKGLLLRVRLNVYCVGNLLVFSSLMTAVVDTGGKSLPISPLSMYI